MKLTKVEKIEYAQRKKKFEKGQQKESVNIEQGKEKDAFEKVETVILSNKDVKVNFELIVKDYEDEDEDDSSSEKDQYYLAAFIKELKDTNFINRFERISRDSTYRYYSDWYNDLSYQQKKQYQKTRKNKNYLRVKENIDSIIIMEPNYYAIDSRRNVKLKINESLEKNEGLKQSLAESAKKYNKRVINLAYTKDDSITLNKVKIQFLINEWHNELMESYEYKMLPFSQTKADKLFDSIGYNSVMFSGIVSERVKSRTLPLLGTIIYPLAPIFIGIYATPKYDVYKYITIIDRNGFLKLKKYTVVNNRGNVFLDALFVDDIFDQISNKK